MRNFLRSVRSRRGFASRAVTLTLLLAAAVWMASSRAPWAAPSGEKAPSRVAPLLASELPEKHLTRRPFDEALVRDALDLFLSSVDFDRTVFMQSDVDEFRARAPALVGQMEAGEISLAFDVFDRFKARLADRVGFTEKLLAKGCDLERADSYQWRRKDVAWPAGTNEWDALWDQKIRNELLARIVAVKLTEEAAQTKPAPEAGTPDAPPPPADPAVPEKAAPAQNPIPDKALTPEAFVLKRYREYLLLLKDSDEEWILDRFYSAFTQSYDPHSDYMSPARSEDFDITMRLSLVGIGAMLTTEDGAAKIERLVPGGPAERDGRLHSGDRIIAIAQDKDPAVEVLHWPLSRVVRLIRGERGTRVVLTIWPAGDISGATERRVDLIRDEVKLEESAASGTVQPYPSKEKADLHFGVLKLPEFYADFKGMRENGEEARRSSRDVRRILEDFRRDNVDGVVLDLRRNGGGSLPDAVEIAGLFIESGPVVQVRDERRVQALSDPDPDVVYSGPLVVLVDRMSASASEIVAAALQDYHRAVIIGDRKTHGKGTVQTVIPLDRNDDSMGQLKITTASFYRIAGGSTQLKGVESDIPVMSSLDALEIGEESLPHALPWSRVNAAFYAVFDDIKPSMPELRSHSEARRASDPEFIHRNELIARISERVKGDTISLNLDERLRQAHAERDLDRLQRDLEAEPADQAKPADAHDLVLHEALNVLAEMVPAPALPPPVPVPVPEPGTATPEPPAPEPAQAP